MEHTNARVPIIYCRVIMAAASKDGVDHKRLLAGTTINRESLKHLEGGITLRDYRQLLRNAKVASGRDTILLDAGIGIPMTAHGPLGQAFAFSRDGMTMLNLLAKFVKLRGFFSSVRVTQQHDKTTCIIALDPALEEDKNDALDFLLASIVDGIKSIGLFSVLSFTISLTRKQPTDYLHYQQVLGADIFYEQTQDSITLNTQELLRPLVTHDAAQFDLALRKCNALIATDSHQQSSIAAVEHVFEQSPGMLWNINQVAESLHISPRTLQRRLKEHNTSYQAVLDKWLKHLAVSYLVIDNVSVEATAMLLGYHDEANFRRAFKRWYGCSPSAYKKRSQLTG